MPSFAEGFFIAASNEAMRNAEKALNPWRETAKQKPHITGDYLCYWGEGIFVMRYYIEIDAWYRFHKYEQEFPTHWKHLSLPPCRIDECCQNQL